MPSPDAGIAAMVGALIDAEGPLPVERYMALANRHYYATRDPLGGNGDFVTAPEISQMFGEMVGLALADAWVRAGRPPCAYVELGPGRGTLARDALRAMAAAGLAPPVHLVETSPALAAIQRERLPAATLHAGVATLPDDAALLVVANEFLDALPVRQRVRAGGAWRERVVVRNGDRLAFAAGPAVAEEGEAPEGAIREACPAAEGIVAALAARLAARGGVLLAIDYGDVGDGAGDTLQAVRGHAYADPLDRPGTADLTAHVRFTALARAAAAAGASVHGPIEQGPWLAALGLAGRAAALARANPGRADSLAADYARLTAADAMGRLFKVLGITGGGWPAPAGLA